MTIPEYDQCDCGKRGPHACRPAASASPLDLLVSDVGDIVDKEKFPLQCVKHLARCACKCQQSGPDVDNNRHVISCMVGKAQAYLGIKVTDKPLYSGYR